MYPVLLEVQGFQIPTYGFVYLVGFVIGLWMVGPIAREEGFCPHRIRRLGIECIIVARIGSVFIAALVSRTGTSIGQLARYTGAFSWALLVGMLFVWVYTRYHRLPHYKVLDCFSLPLVLGQAIGRIGCVTAGCCYGTVTTSSVGVTFRNPLSHKISGVPLNVKLHPVQLYECGAAIITFAFLSWLNKRYKGHWRDGQRFSVMLGAVSVSRLLLDVFRYDHGRTLLWGVMSLPQLVAFALLMLSIVLWCSIQKRYAGALRLKSEWQADQAIGWPDHE